MPALKAISHHFDEWFFFYNIFSQNQNVATIFIHKIQNNKCKHILYMNDVNANFEMREVSVKLTSHDRNLSSFPILHDWTPRWEAKSVYWVFRWLHRNAIKTSHEGWFRASISLCRSVWCKVITTMSLLKIVILFDSSRMWWIIFIWMVLQVNHSC